jgi:hypothetical protein
MRDRSCSLLSRWLILQPMIRRKYAFFIGLLSLLIVAVSFATTFDYAEFRQRGRRVRLHGYNITNNEEFRTGRLRMRLWATDVPWDSTDFGYILGRTPMLRSLPPNSYYDHISRRVRFRRPPSGYYYLTMSLEERLLNDFGNYEWFIVDHIEFNGLYYFYQYTVVLPF